MEILLTTQRLCTITCVHVWEAKFPKPLAQTTRKHNPHRSDVDNKPHVCTSTKDMRTVNYTPHCGSIFCVQLVDLAGVVTEIWLQRYRTNKATKDRPTSKGEGPYWESTYQKQVFGREEEGGGRGEGWQIRGDTVMDVMGLNDSPHALNRGWLEDLMSVSSVHTEASVDKKGNKWYSGRETVSKVRKVHANVSNQATICISLPIQYGPLSKLSFVISTELKLKVMWRSLGNRNTLCGTCILANKTHSTGNCVQ